MREYHIPLDRIPFDHHHCFLCGKDSADSLEHVFPAWLQRRFQLWDQQLNLLNGTPIPYRNLTVPCSDGDG